MNSLDRKAWFYVLLIVCLISLIPTSILYAEQLILATTTSTYNSGLLDLLKPAFENQYEDTLDILAVGTGKALKYAMDGNADVLLVHAPKAEKKFMNEGHGVLRCTLMFNDFVLAGPPDLEIFPELKSAVDFFKYVYENKLLFVSRGDNSGTHKKEKTIWDLANLSPENNELSFDEWYLSTGQGMGPTLLIASEKEGVVLTDRGTFLSYKDKVRLKVVYEGDKILWNPYSIIIVNPAKNSKINYTGALDFLRFMLDPETLNLIRNFKKEGTALFKTLINPKLDEN